MLSKKSTKILGLVIFSVLMIFMLAAVTAVDANSPPATVTSPLLTTPDSLAASGSSTSPDNTVKITAPAGTQFSIVVEKVKTGATNVMETIFGKTWDDKSPFDLAFAKFLVFALILIIVYGLVGLLPFFDGLEGREKKVIHWVFSGIVAFLSVMYVTPEEIYASLVGYGAMAVILTSIIPFAIILALSWKLAQDPNIANQILQKVLLWGFGIYLIAKIAMLTVFERTVGKGVGEAVWSYAIIIYGVMFVVVIIFAISDKNVRAYFLKMQMTKYIDRMNLMSEAQLIANRALLITQRNALVGMGDVSTNPLLTQEINGAIAAIDKQILAVK